MLELPETLRGELKDPLGEIYTDPDALLAAVDDHAGATATADASSPPARLLTVGDVVTATLADAGRQPDIAVIDGRTEREPVDPAVEATLTDLTGRRLSVTNPPATISESLLTTLREAATDTEYPVTISVDGEEDLAALPAILAVPDGASVVYGQPGEGMVHVPVRPAVRTTARELLAEFDGETDAAISILE
ncbi:GTP-dependent dephospho-CoA kinase family protein [Halonotius sp. GCM10025705]|uniref:GTP-dependent dephospho-CoA kinase family protein n=1 Tax=Halonotius sp. GCM10025705 TaxID=3252678 RepID=UPI003612C449